MGGSSPLKRSLTVTAIMCVLLVGAVAVSIYIVNSGGPATSANSSVDAKSNEIAQVASSGGNLEILNAVWRVPDRGDFDATAKIAGMVKNGELHIKVGAAALGLPGPAPGVTGTLVLRYRMNGVEQTKSTRGGGTLLNIVPSSPSTAPSDILATSVTLDPSILPSGLGLAPGTLPVGRGILEIDQALWRLQGRPDFDATGVIADLVKDGVLNTRVNWEVLGLPKPPQGSTAMLVLRYSVNGVQQTRSVRGGGTPLIIVAPPASLLAPEPSAADEPATTRAAASPIADDVKAFTNSIEMKFVRIEPGEFIMGMDDNQPGDTEEAPQHKARITKAYFLQTTEVTQKQFLAIMSGNPSSFKGDNLPVEQITWADAVAFCKKLSAKEGRTYRLPTEAEWEYACRAGTTALIPAGAKLDDVAWHKGNSEKQSHPVGVKQANPWGLYDTLGNVSEWCSDWYGPYSVDDTVDPNGPDTGTLRVLRGGSWYVDSTRTSAVHRHGYAPIGRFASNVGFRPVLETQ